MSSDMGTLLLLQMQLEQVDKNVVEDPIELSCSLASMRCRGAARTVLLEAAKELGIGNAESLELAAWLLFGRTAVDAAGLDKDFARAVVRFCWWLLDGSGRMTVRQLCGCN